MSINRAGVSLRRSVFALMVVISTASIAAGHDFAIAQIRIVNPSSRATTPGAAVGAGYMTVVNNGANAIRLVGASTSDAERVEIHSMSMDGGIMRMRPMPDGVVVPPHSQFQFSPGGVHFMLIGLKRPLLPGSRVPMTVFFDRNVSVNIELAVGPAGAGQ